MDDWACFVNVSIGSTRSLILETPLDCRQSYEESRTHNRPSYRIPDTYVVSGPFFQMNCLLSDVVDKLECLAQIDLGLVPAIAAFIADAAEIEDRPGLPGLG